MELEKMTIDELVDFGVEGARSRATDLKLCDAFAEAILRLKTANLEIERLREAGKSDAAFRRRVNEALNSGDGVYRP